MKKPEKSFFDMNMQERWNETLGSFIQRDFSVVDASVFSSYLASGDSGKFCFRQFDFAGCSKSHETSEEKRTLCKEHFQSVDFWLFSGFSWSVMDATDLWNCRME